MTVVGSQTTSTAVLPVEAADPTVATVEPAEPAGDERPAQPDTGRPWWRRRRVRADFASVGGYLLLALYVTQGMWLHLHSYVLSSNATDQTQFEYFLEHAVRVVTHGENPFFTHWLNAPDGVNLMANTATLGLHLPLVPVTMLFGPQVSFAVMVTFGLFSTATAWYWLFSRHLVGNRIAAFVAGVFCGFAPGMVSQANGHPNIAVQVLVPIILWRVIRLREPGRVLRNGLVLGLLVTYQAFINEEVLFFAALAIGLFVVVWALHHRQRARQELPVFVRGLGVATLVSLVLLAYPLYVQFFGPQHYEGMLRVAANYGTDPASFFSFSRQSLAGFPVNGIRLAPNPSEENAFFGWPLVVLVAMLAVMFRKHVVARAAGAVGLVFAVLSIGARLSISGEHTDIPGPYLPLSHVPVFASVITTRLVLVAIPAIAVLLALWLDNALTNLRGSREQVFRGRLVAVGLVALALVSLAPQPLPVATPNPTPVFFASGEWRQFVPAGRTVVTVPVTSLSDAMEGMRWATAEHLELTLAGGYFLGPDEHGAIIFGAPARPTSTILDHVNTKKGKIPDITAANQADAVRDLRFWRAAIVVLDPTKKWAPQLRLVVSQLLGSYPRLIDGVWVWDVRPIVGYS